MVRREATSDATSGVFVRTGSLSAFNAFNRKYLKFAKAEEDIAKVLKADNGIPHTFRIVAVSNISSRLRDKIKNHVLSLGVKVCENWSGPEFEEFLRHGSESLLRDLSEGKSFLTHQGI
jgi:hypothetical protein